MANTTGVIEGFTTRQGTSKAGRPFTIHCVRVGGEEYEVGFQRPSHVSVGDYVDINWEVKFGKKAANHLAKGTLPAAGASPTNTPMPAPAPVGPGPRPGNFRPFPIPMDHGDRSIIRQNSIMNAREFVKQFYDEAPEGVALRRLFEVADLFETYSSGGQSALEIAATLKMNEPPFHDDLPDFSTAGTAGVSDVGYSKADAPAPAARPRGRPRAGAVANG